MQNFGYRRGGCLENGYGLFGSVHGRARGNHARGWAQAGGATFLALSEEHFCRKVTSPLHFHVWHCIDIPDGFDAGRNDFVQEVKDNAYKGYTVQVIPHHEAGLQLNLDLLEPTGTDNVPYSDIVDVLRLRRAFPNYLFGRQKVLLEKLCRAEQPLQCYRGS